jgi:hypothetical protein
MSVFLVAAKSILVTRENEIHKQLIEERVSELGRQSAISEQLQKALKEQSNLYNSLQHTLENIPIKMKEDLTKEDNQLAKLLSAVNATQAK